MATRNEFFGALCAAMGWEPTPWRLAVMDFWADQEDGGDKLGLMRRANNPFATTREDVAASRDLSYDNGNGPGNWNTIKLASGGVLHVGVYLTLADGVRATAQTINLSYYPNIRRSFRDQVGYPEVVSDYTSWVSEPYGQRIYQFMRTTTASREIPPVPATVDPKLEARVAVLEGLNPALQKRFALMRLALDADLPTVEAACAKLGLS